MWRGASHAGICRGNLPGDLTQAAENNDARAEQTTASPNCYSLPAHTGHARCAKNVLYYYLAAWCAAVIKTVKKKKEEGNINTFSIP